MRRIHLYSFIFFILFLQTILCFDDEADYEIKQLVGGRPPRVDAGVKRPYRACQGFEDPEEVDCYMRSELKKYVCTEPTTFNPCESEVRVTTYHYDHIKHRCEKVKVPACSGQIIRAMSLIQCLIYCHNSDPFALGKSTSMVFKLNQKKPYIAKDDELEEREKGIDFINDVETKYETQDKTTENENVLQKKEIENNEAIKISYVSKTMTEKNVKKNQEKAINSINQLNNAEQNIEKKERLYSEEKGTKESDFGGTKSLLEKNDNTLLSKKEINIDDQLGNKNKEVDDGFYLWDE